MIETSGNSGAPPAHAKHPAAWPQLTVDRDVEVCVVGAGLAGLQVAIEAARHGLAVALIEAGEPAARAAMHHGGLVWPGYPIDLAQLVSRLGFAPARDLVALAGEGVAAVRAQAEAWDCIDRDHRDGLLQVAADDSGGMLLTRLQTLNDLGLAAEGWQVEQVRAAVRSRRVFHGLHWREAFMVRPRPYAEALIAEAMRLGVRCYAGTPAIAIDPAGIRKIVMTPAARLRAGHLVLAGNVHLGAVFPQLAATLIPIWRHVAVTEPLGARLDEALAFAGTVTSEDGSERFARIPGGDRLMWSGRLTAFDMPSRYFNASARRRLRALFPQLGAVTIAQSWSGVDGHTVHAMPQIGELGRGVWIAGGFNGQGLGLAALAGRLIADGIALRDDRWRMLSPFELVWAGGVSGRVVAQGVIETARTASGWRGLVARLRERRRDAVTARRAARVRSGVTAASPLPPP